MNEAIALLIVMVIAIACLSAFFSAVGIYFPKWVHGARQAATASPGRAFAIGFVNVLFFGVLGLAFLALADSSGMQFLALPGLLVALLLVVALCLGLAGVVEEAGERLSPALVGLRRTLLGTTVIGLACALPFVGWFLLLPYLSMLGLGGLIIYAINAYRQRQKENA